MAFDCFPRWLRRNTMCSLHPRSWFQYTLASSLPHIPRRRQPPTKLRLSAYATRTAWKRNILYQINFRGKLGFFWQDNSVRSETGRYSCSSINEFPPRKRENNDIKQVWDEKWMTPNICALFPRIPSFLLQVLPCAYPRLALRNNLSLYKLTRIHKGRTNVHEPSSWTRLPCECQNLVDRGLDELCVWDTMHEFGIRFCLPYFLLGNSSLLGLL